MTGHPPPQSSPTRGEEVGIDDRRRFKELWKELLVRCAVVAPGALIFSLVSGYYRELWEVWSRPPYLTEYCFPSFYMLALLARSVLFEGNGDWFFLAEEIALACLHGVVLALPIGFVKRGKFLCLGGIAVILGYWTINFTAFFCFGSAVHSGQLIFMLGLGALAAYEGWLERSLATMAVGFICGALSTIGAMPGFLLSHAISRFVIEVPPQLTAVLAMMGIQVGIGLSLALGRYLRDLPKRK